MSSGSASPPSASTTARRSFSACGTSRPTTLAPSRPSVAAIAAPIPREAPVTSAVLPGQRQVPVDLRRRGDALGDADHLAVDVGRARREQEAQGRVELVLGARLDVDELRGRALAADLLGERAGEALQRALGGVGAGRAGERRGGAEDDDPAAAAQPRHGGVEEALQLDQLGRVGDARRRRRRAPWPCPRRRRVRRRSRRGPSSASAPACRRGRRRSAPARRRPGCRAGSDRGRPAAAARPAWRRSRRAAR